jgi:predicted secreted hydrolase
MRFGESEMRIHRLVGLGVLGFIIAACSSSGSELATLEPARIEAVSPAATPEFERAYEPRPFSFPQDHGPHVSFQTEWWYYTGNLRTSAGRQFGFQLTFFRRGLAPGEAQRQAGLASNQIYFAHFAITDVDSENHVSFERFSRGAAGLAGAQAQPFEVWLEDWRVQALDDQGSRLLLTAAQNDFELELVLDAQKPIVAHGQNGLSPKSAEPGNASYYLSFTRMTAEGELGMEGEQFELEGSAWFDHEWSTSALGSQAQGWDWFSLQLSNNTELMYFQIRNQDGSLDPVSGGTWVDPNGIGRQIDFEEVELEVLGEWISPETGAVYPSGWRLAIPEMEVDLRIEPWIENQEMLTSFIYWEGAVRISGTVQGEQVSGVGFVELTGYLESMQGVF